MYSSRWEYKRTYRNQIILDELSIFSLTLLVRAFVQLWATHKCACINSLDWNINNYACYLYINRRNSLCRYHEFKTKDFTLVYFCLSVSFQFVTQDNLNFWGRMEHYFRDVFKILTVTALILFYIGLILRFSHADTEANFAAARFVYWIFFTGFKIFVCLIKFEKTSRFFISTLRDKNNL